MELDALRRLVAQGEGLHLEFKRKARHPEKLAREFIAFANTRGGRLLLGVEDDGQIFGTKHPGEDLFAMEDFLKKNVLPELAFTCIRVALSARREVLVFDIPSSDQKPHFLLPQSDDDRKQAFIREADMSLAASREMVQILRYAQRKKGVNLRVGEAEERLLQHLEKHATINLAGTMALLRTSRRAASMKLILLTQAGLLGIRPTRQGDLFFLDQNAFE
ncbi:MAG: ATP-binding protein [Bacteroidota bacterium]